MREEHKDVGENGEQDQSMQEIFEWFKSYSEPPGTVQEQSPVLEEFTGEVGRISVERRM